MNRFLHCFSSFVIITCLLIAAPVAQATVIHSNVMGATVVFTGITEGSPTGDPEPLYGQPSANGDTLIFPTTSNFNASSLDGLASDQTDGKLSLMIRAKNGFAISSFSITENGLTSLSAPFGGDAYTEAVAFAVVKVVEIAGAPVSLPSFQAFLGITPLGGQYQLSVIGGTSYNSGWTGTVNLGLPLDTTKVNVTLDNNLFAATSGAATRAFIDKKAFEIDVKTKDLIPNDIPEPATFLLGLVALVGVNLSTFRRQGAF
ncbi:MAG: hypothetical protein SH868_18460 [Bythopirellula sp.]|nr:hypothetical protein [Bythopirellula sp.]